MRLSEELYKRTYDLPMIKGSIFNGNGGYDVQATDDYLEGVADRVKDLETKGEELSNHLKRMNEEKELRGGLPSSPNSPSLQNEKDELSKRIKQIEVLERSYKRMIYLAEQEAEQIRMEAKNEAKDILMDANAKADDLSREVVMRCAEKEREFNTLVTRTEEVKERLKNVVSFISDAVS